MILQNAKLRREIFTQEELSRLEPLILEGQYEYLMNVLDEITPEKEIEIQRIVNYLRPLAQGFESDVRKEMDVSLPKGPQTPEEEAEWEQKLQTEFKEFVNKQSEIRNDTVNSLGYNKEEHLAETRVSLEKKLVAAQKLEKKKNKTEKQEEKLKNLKAEILELQDQEKELE